MNKKYIAPIRIDIPDLKKSISIGKIKLRKITEKEKNKYFNTKKIEYTENGDVSNVTYIAPQKIDFIHLHSQLQDYKLLSCQHIVEYIDKDVLIEELKVLLLALRLYQEGNVFAPLVFHPNGNYLNYIYPTFTTETKKYTINIKNFRRIKKIHSQIKQKKNLAIFFERFNNALSRNTNEINSFIDFVTILESLFLNSSSVQEISFRFSLYTSFILKNKLKEPVTFKEMKNIYDVRSQLVHNGKSKKYSKELHSKTKNYTRILLLWALGNDNFQENMVLNHLAIGDGSK